MKLSPPDAARRYLIPAAAGVAYVLLACSAFGSTLPFDGSRLPQGPTGDPLQMVWFLAWTPWAILHGHDPFFTTAIDYPSGVNLAANTSVPILGTLFAPITYLFNPITTFNVLVRLALAGSAVSMYFVLGRWCRSQFARFLGGLLYGFGPYLATHIHTQGHLNLVFLPIPPLLAWCVDEAFFEERRSPVRLGIATGVLATGQLLISPEVLSDSALVAGAVVAIVAIAHRDLVRRRLRRAITVVSTAAVTFLALSAWPLIEMLTGRGHVRGPVASVRHLQSFRIDLLGPFLPTSHQLLAPAGAVRAAIVASLPVARAGGGSELGSYLGIPLVVACAVVVVVLRRDGVVRGLAIVGAVAFVLSLGGRLEIDGHVTSVPLPEALLAHLPLLKNTVPARFSALAAFAAAGLLALGMDRFATKIANATRRRRRLGAVAAVAAGLLILLPLAPSGTFASETVAVDSAVAPALASQIPTGATLLTYPYPDPPFTVAMGWQALSRIRYSMIGGYATVPTRSGAGAIFAPLLTPPSIQEFLAFAESGRARHYPRSGVPSLADLCAFVLANHVTDVVFARYGPDSGAVETFFRAGFGTPHTLAGLEIWGPSSRGRCTLG
jgi:hypothetical protein